jgi:hypothetical protein
MSLGVTFSFILKKTRVGRWVGIPEPPKFDAITNKTVVEIPDKIYTQDPKVNKKAPTLSPSKLAKKKRS